LTPTLLTADLRHEAVLIQLQPTRLSDRGVLLKGLRSLLPTQAPLSLTPQPLSLLSQDPHCSIWAWLWGLHVLISPCPRSPSVALWVAMGTAPQAGPQNKSTALGALPGLSFKLLVMPRVFVLNYLPP
jgi:hypothetical protein